MSIATEITRLQGIKTDIAAAINGKGGNAGSVMSGFAAAIAAIPTSGGGGGSSATVETATASATNSLTISFSGLTKQPKMWAVIATSQFATAGQYCILSVVSDGTTTQNVTHYERSSMYAGYAYVGTRCTATYSNGTLTIKSPSNDANGGQFRATSYRLFACG